MDWEKDLCNLINSINESKDDSEYYEALEEVVMFVEDLVFMAYAKGKLNRE